MPRSTDDLPRGWYQARNGVRISPEQKTAFSSGLSRGLSTNAIIEILKGTTLKINRQAAYQLTEDLFGHLRKGGALQKKPANYVPNDFDYQNIPQRSDRRYRTTGMIDLSHLGIFGVEQYYGFHHVDRHVPLDAQRRAIFRQLGPLIQSLKNQYPEEDIDISEADIRFIGAEQFLP